MLMLDYAFSHLGLRNVLLTVQAENATARRVYQKCGFRMLRVERDFFDYIQPPIVEDGIGMRDMIVFSYEAVTAPTAPPNS